MINWDYFLMRQKPKTGTEIVNEVIGQFESIQNKLEDGISLIEDDVALNDEKITELQTQNRALGKTKERAQQSLKFFSFPFKPICRKL